MGSWMRQFIYFRKVKSWIKSIRGWLPGTVSNWFPYMKYSRTKKLSSIIWTDMKNVLKEKFPEQVRDIYISYPHFESERADNRSRYRELMKYLKKIQRYLVGKERRLRLRRTGRFLLWHGRQRKRTEADDCAYKHIKRFETGQKR